ncbi:MAG: hypothetical protein ACPGJV_01980 [Bacteriovoracaceae bacterium]
MSDSDLVWSSEGGDLRKNKKNQGKSESVNEDGLEIHLRRLSSGKGRVIIELSNLPSSKAWCKKLASELKKKLGVGGAYKKDFIEVHGEKLDQVIELLQKRNLKFKKIGG